MPRVADYPLTTAVDCRLYVNNDVAFAAVIEGVIRATTEQNLTDDVDRTIQDLIAEHGQPPVKNLKGAARQRFNRRKLWLADAMRQLEGAIATLRAQDGTVYKSGELDALTAAIDAFRQQTGLVAPEPPAPTQEELDRFMDWLETAPAYEPLSKEQLAQLHASLESVPDHEPDGDYTPAAT